MTIFTYQVVRSSGRRNRLSKSIFYYLQENSTERRIRIFLSYEKQILFIRETRERVTYNNSPVTLQKCKHINVNINYNENPKLNADNEIKSTLFSFWPIISAATKTSDKDRSILVGELIMRATSSFLQFEKLLRR